MAFFDIFLSFMHNYSGIIYSQLRFSGACDIWALAFDFLSTKCFPEYNLFFIQITFLKSFTRLDVEQFLSWP